MTIPRILAPLVPTRRGRPDRPMIAAQLTFLMGVAAVLATLSFEDEQWAAVALGAAAGSLLVGGCVAYLAIRIVRGVRRLRGEREPEPPPEFATEAPAARPHRTRKLFLWLVGLPVVLVVFSVVFTLVVMKSSSRRVEQVRDSLQPGMNASQVMQKATGWFMMSARPLRPDRAEQGLSISSFHQGRYYPLAFGGEPSPPLTEVELLDRIREMSGGGEWKLVFTYTTVTPARYSFAVRFSPEGKVVEVSPVSGWD